MKNRMILFVCTGNVCRSPMAEHMLRQRLGRNSKWKVCSAGLSAGAGMPASQSAVEMLRKHRIDMSAHRSRQVSRELVDEASLILVMTVGHLEEMRSLFPDAEQKTLLLRSFEPSLADPSRLGQAAEDKDISDPIGLPTETVYGEVYRQIEMSLPGLIEFMEEIK